MTMFEAKQFGRYRILSILAQGGMGELCKAVVTGEEGFEKLVAIKKLHPHLAADSRVLASFIDEARLAALLQHHNVVAIHDFGSIEGVYYIAMEYLPGKDLSRVLERACGSGMPLGLEHALFIASRICAGLDYAHRLSDHSGQPLNIIHRDISPQNIFITYDGNVKIVDFGIAKTSGNSTQTQCGTIKGKAGYMSPEQARAQILDRRSDIFSAGILLSEMITGRKLFTAETTLQVLQKVSAGDFEAPEAAAPGLPPALHEILHRALDYDLDKRFQSGADMLTAIEACTAEHGLQSSAWSLSRYMRQLFAEEIAAEHAPLRTDSEKPAAGAQLFTREEERIFQREITSSLGCAGLPGRGGTALPGRHSRLVAAAAVVAIFAASLFFGFQKVSSDSLLARAQACMISRDYCGAAGLYEKFLESFPSDIELVAEPYTRALQQLPASWAERAKGIVQQQALTENAQAWFFLGFVCGRLRDAAGAAAAYETAIQLNPKFAESYFNLGHIYAQEKKFSEAEALFRKVVELAPGYVDEALYNLAVVIERQGRTQESRRLLEQALSFNPRNEKAQSYLAKVSKAQLR
jgi:serine/threonine protein kinase/cytochrome c-type biogenesis protein CcmH/NrfG